jgi:ATP-dependent Lon protease
MANSIKNLLSAKTPWLIFAHQDTDAVEIIPRQSGDPMVEEVKIPDNLPILPIRNAVLFPGTITPLAIGRDKSEKLLSSIKVNESLIGMVAQKDSGVDDPDFKDLYSVGTIASILKIIKMPQGALHVVVHGLSRFKITAPIQTEPFLTAKIKVLPESFRLTKKLKALVVNIRHAANRVITLSPNVPEEVSLLLENIDNPSAMADFLAANLNLTVPRKQLLLEEANPIKRLEAISMALANQLELLELSHKIQGRVKQSVDKSQREYYLQEQLKVIQNELGLGDRKTEELKQLTQNIKKAKMPKVVEKEAILELDRLVKIPPSSPEYSVIRTYLDCICQLPWNLSTEDRLDINQAQNILNREHYGLEKIKKRILEFLAVRKLNPKGKSPILCFVGPPGVGKTSLGKSIAHAMQRKFVRISLGGIRDEADIRGHRRTYIGAMPGRILQELRKCATNNPVFMLDELDKIGADFRGDPSSALLEVLDPEQNNTFTDHYIDQPFDLSKVMFIGTANYLEPIPPALKDRMEVITLPGYTQNEKLNIAKKYLVKRQLKAHGLTTKQLKLKPDAISEIIDKYTREAGVRNLERTIAAVCRNIATKIAKKNKRSATITKESLSKILGPEKFESELALRTAVPGVATGLAYTPVGGEILFVEAASMPGKGKLQLTGQIGDVMTESAQTAFSLIKSNAQKLKIDPAIFPKTDFHVHVPAGAIPKDGPSAGITMFVSLASLLLNKTVRPDIAMTGEITLRGLVLPIGGLKEKTIAAKQAGIKTVLIPQRNKKDLTDIPAETKKGITFKYVKNAEQALKLALTD